MSSLVVRLIPRYQGNASRQGGKLVAGAKTISSARLLRIIPKQKQKKSLNIKAFYVNDFIDFFAPLLDIVIRPRVQAIRDDLFAI